jgi:membrane-bound serine protease (ClpP class)
MIGKTVPAITRIDAQNGKVLFEGEYWNATSDATIEAGQPAEIVEITGLTLHVKKGIGICFNG